MSQKTYTVNRHRQLVDLNGDSKNFDLTFTCTSADGAPFEILVVDQATLDSTPNLQYKKANGTISGNIVADKNVYQNYFLVLKADKPCQVAVKTIKKDIQPNLPTPQRPTSARAPQMQRAPSMKPPARPTKCNWKIIAIAVIILGGGALLYYFYTQNKNKKDTSAVPAAADSVPSSPAPSTSALSPQAAMSGGLLDRLKSLDMTN